MLRSFSTISILILFGFVNLFSANTIVPFELINGLIVVNAEINGQVGNYIIDSGANGILLNESSNSSDVSYQSISSTIEGSETKIESFKVGDFEANQLQGFSTDLTNLEAYIDKSLAGILGASIFAPNLLELDFENSKLIITESFINIESIKGLNKLTFDIKDELPIVEIEVQGQTLSFILDSGASSHFIDQTILSTLDTKQTGVSRDIITASKDIHVAKEFSVSSCNVGSISSSLDFFEKDFSIFSNEFGIEIAGLISLSKLAKGKLFFDLKSRQLYF